MVYFLYSLQLCLQFIATCSNQGSQNGINYTADVWDISAIDTLSFTKSSAKSNASEVFMTKRHEVCQYNWMKDSQSMLLGPVLQCNTTNTTNGTKAKSLHYHKVIVTCTFSDGKVCRIQNAGNSTTWDNEGECVKILH